MDVTIRQLQAMRMAAVRHIGPYHTIGASFDRLFEWVDTEQVPVEGTIAVYLDNPQTTPGEELRSDAGVVVPASFESNHADVVISDMPAGTYAVYSYVGPYSGLQEAWHRFMREWFPTSGHEMGEGLPFEMYLNDPCETPADQLITEIYAPVRG